MHGGQVRQTLRCSERPPDEIPEGPPAALALLFKLVTPNGGRERPLLHSRRKALTLRALTRGRSRGGLVHLHGQRKRLLQQRIFIHRINRHALRLRLAAGRLLNRRTLAAGAGALAASLLRRGGRGGCLPRALLFHGHAQRQGLQGGTAAHHVSAPYSKGAA